MIKRRLHKPFAVVVNVVEKRIRRSHDDPDLVREGIRTFAT